MLILIEILFLIFGILFDKNGLLITTLVLSSFWSSFFYCLYTDFCWNDKTQYLC